MKHFVLTKVTFLILNFIYAQVDTVKFTYHATILKLIENNSLAKADSVFNEYIAIYQNDYFFDYLKGLWFLRKNEFDSAQIRLANSVKKVGDSNDLIFIHLALADAYIGSKDYQKALVVLGTSYPYSEIHTRFYKFRNIDYRKAQCYAGLNNIDAAVSILTPFIFSVSNSIDGQKTKEVVLYYKWLLLKKYTIKPIKKELRMSIRKINFENTFLSKKTSLADTMYLHEWKHKSYTYFLNAKVNLKNTNRVYLNKTEVKSRCPKEFKRKQLAKIIKHSFFYKDIFNKSN